MFSRFNGFRSLSAWHRFPNKIATSFKAVGPFRTIQRSISYFSNTHSQSHLFSGYSYHSFSIHNQSFFHLEHRLYDILTGNFFSGFKHFFPDGQDKKEKKENADNKGTDKGKKNDQENENKDFKENKPPKKEPDNDDSMETWLYTAAFVLMYLIYGAVTHDIRVGEEISYQEFVTEYLQRGRVEKLIIVNNSRALVYVKDGEKRGEPVAHFQIGSVESFERKVEDTQRSLNIPQNEMLKITYKTDVNIYSDILRLIPTLALIGMSIYMFKTLGSMGGLGGGSAGSRSSRRNIFSFGKSPAVMIKPGEKPKVTFKDVAGLDEAKVEVMEFVKFLKDPTKFHKLGAKIPKGALLVGPPGTGKTLLAKATAGEASVPFFTISGSDFIEMFVGVGPSRVRDLFSEARKNSPCIIFIDEIDAVGRARAKGGWSSGNDERESTLNQLLVEMDGFNTESGVVVLAGTNRIDILDKALLRPGRFDRQIQIEKPDLRGRKQIFEVHLKSLKLKIEIGELAQRLAALTPGFSGADIANVCNEAAIIAARYDHTHVELADFEAACDRVIAGLEKKTKVMTAEERKLIAYHEAGHAVSGWFLKYADPILKVTIIPRSKGSLGFAQYLPQELALYSKEQLVDMMCMALGGRAAEQVFFGRVSTGAADDLKRVTKLAYSQVTIYGMSEKLGNVSYQSDDEGTQFVKPYSEETARAIDTEVNEMVRNCYDRVIKLVEEKKHLVDAVAKKLLEQETINHDVITAILGERPYKSEHYAEFLAEKDKPLETEGEKKDKAEREQKEREQKEREKNTTPSQVQPV